eukprot:gene23316-31647_t
MSTGKKYALLGTIIHSLRLGEIEIIEKGLMVYAGNGVIESVHDISKQPPSGVQSLLQGLETVADYTDKLIIPGFVDAHCHAPQYVFSGTGMDLPLLEWLQTYTFPCEAKFQDKAFARVAYERSVSRHLRSGTTMASYFATIHKEASKTLAEVLTSVGQRAFVGKVSMDRHSPPFYIEGTDDGCREMEEFVQHVLGMTAVGQEHLTACLEENGINKKGILDRIDTPRVLPIITPRFVPTCSEQMMKKLGDLSSKYLLPVQSHLSESLAEISWVSELHPDCPTYAHVYQKYGLLHSHTYMAHCCHSNEAERALMKSLGVGAVHCASSNFMLSSGVMDVRGFLDEGLKVAIGTDVAGGYSASMLDAIRQTIIASRVKEINSAASSSSSGSDGSVGKGYRGLTYAEVFHLATVGGAEVLGMGSVVGNFLPGKKLDCLVVDPLIAGGPFDVFPGEDASAKFQKFLFLGDDRNIITIIVDGQKVL